MLPLRWSPLAVVFSVLGLCLLPTGCSQSVVNDYGAGTEAIQVDAASGHPLLGDWIRMDDESQGAIVRFEASDDGVNAILIYPGANLASYGFRTGQIKIRDLQSTEQTHIWRCRSRVQTGDGWGGCDRFWFDDVHLELSEGRFFLRGEDALESQRWIRLDAENAGYAHLLFGLCELASQRADDELLSEAASLLAAEKQSLSAAELNAVAWDLATAAESGQRHPELAVALAEEACRKDGFNEWNYVDTLAAAYAAVGRWDEAIRHQQQVCDNGWVDGASTRLRLFRQQRPYIQEMNTAPQAPEGDSLPGAL